MDDDINVTSSPLGNYNLDNVEGENPTITLVRTGNYRFHVNQPGNPFWIQTEPGVNGTLNHSPNIGSRDVLGVVNNGAEGGVVTFNVPAEDAQQEFQDLDVRTDVDFITTRAFDSIDGMNVNTIEGVDNVADIENRTVVFLNRHYGLSDDLGWVQNGVFDGDYDYEPFAPATYFDTLDERTQLFRITFVTLNGSPDQVIRLVPVSQIEIGERFTIKYGEEYSNRNFYRNDMGYIEELPLLTAANDVLYYQDGVDPNKFGTIKLVDPEQQSTLDISDILGKKNYTSPNGVVFTNGLKVKFRGDVLPAEYIDNEYYVEGVGEAIRLVAVKDLITPEKYIEGVDVPWDIYPWDTLAWQESANAPEVLDYLTINRASRDLNAWTRSNRWFHIDVIRATAEYNNTDVNLDNDQRAQRPIIEFIADLKLFNYGTELLDVINVIDFTETDALSNIHGSVGHYVDQYQLNAGSRVVFAADTDAEVRKKVYEVQIIDPDGNDPEYSNVINLVETGLVADVDHMVICQSGRNIIGNQYVFDGTDWILGQEKTNVNQSPYFDAYDSEGDSFSDFEKYKSSTFAGTKIFSYKVGSSLYVDPYLGFALSYQNIDNLGDIVFENNLFSDTFSYVTGTTSEVDYVNRGFIRRYDSRTDYHLKIGWVNTVDENWQRQVFEFDYTGVDLILDVLPRNDLNIDENAIKVYVNNKFIYPKEYTVTLVEDQTFITLHNATIDDKVLVKIVGKTESTVAYYEVPNNLESNVFNDNVEQLSLGTIRNHYNKLVENIRGFEGQVNGANNLRDQGFVPTYGDTIVQHSAPMALTGLALAKPRYDLFDAIDFNDKQYEKFKYQLIEWLRTHEYYDRSPADILDQALKEINIGKTQDSTFYWTDMLPYGGDYTTTEFEISVVSTDTFNTVNTYDFDTANFTGLLVYLNDRILMRDIDYTVATDGPRVTLLADVEYGDKLVFREYNTTYGSFVPPTPTKMGLYPAFRPRAYIDDTYQQPQKVIQGHDGSITIAFGDVLDDVMLEFETRIYNNLRSEQASEVPVQIADVVAGQFRNTEFTDDEVNDILSAEFLNWVGWHKIDYKTNTYQADNEWTWNYNKASNKLDGTPLKGNWRGVYKYVYDTDKPHTNPWEMIGLSKKPLWWEGAYGPAPYTSGNLVLWKDLEQGLIKDPINPHIDERYARPGLLEIIPVDTAGKLKTPFDVLVKNYTKTDFNRAWQAGDIGPAENAWRRSSSWPFAVQKLLALTQPAKYFALNADRDRNQYSPLTDQVMYDLRFRLDAREVEIAGPGVSKHSYFNWIVEYNKNAGVDIKETLEEELSNLDVRLCYRMASFTDPKYLKIFVDKSSPTSSNASLLIPDESFKLIVHKNQPFDDIQYSSIIIQKVELAKSSQSDQSVLAKQIYAEIDAINNTLIELEDAIDAGDDERVEEIIGTVPTVDHITYFVNDALQQRNALEERLKSLANYNASDVEPRYGYAVYGNSRNTQYFNILESIPNGHFDSFYVGAPGGDNTVLRLPKDFYDNVYRIPYGTIFTNENSVVDFLASYGEYLQRQGMIFQSVENSYEMNWRRMAEEFAYWANQGWVVGSMININPSATELEFERDFTVLEDLRNLERNERPLDQNKQPMEGKDYCVTRLDNNFKFHSILEEKSLSYIRLKAVSYEHLLVLDNMSIFDDLIYEPVTGLRQHRVRLDGFSTYGWTGQLDAPGFILNQDNVEEWKAYTSYNKGDIVFYKNSHWASAIKVQPQAEFNFDEWIRINYDQISKGLLPNLSTKADSISKYYDKSSANLESDANLLGLGLTGFRSRSYMDGLNLNDSSQINV
ncbi:MAG: hypothetical protein V2I33_16850, partial [Kangiellaceae bacterium]|nr:hypothetical protein [Kangiellaceae bacterium]